MKDKKQKQLKQKGDKKKKETSKKILPEKKLFQKSGKWYVLPAILFVAVCILGAILFIQSYYTVTTVFVEGNIHYTNDEIMDIVMEGKLGKNSLYLSLKYKNRDIKGIPFVESMDVTIVSPDTIRISVYEKSLAGYVEYLGKYLYFDKDGIVVESSDSRTAGIPQVSGLEFGYVVLYEKLPVKEEAIFMKVLDTTQLLKKYNIMADKIYFDQSYEMTLFFEKVKVKIGDTDGIDEKIMKLQYILPELEGKSGTIRMESYTEESKNITFALD